MSSELGAIQDSKAIKVGDSILASFMSFVSIDANRKKVEKIPSADHSAAQRIVALLVAYKAISKSNYPGQLNGSSIINEVLNWVMWFRGDNYKMNNHGLMACYSIILSDICLPNNVVSEKDINLAISRVTELAEYSFDSKGMCNENTIGYHRFNMSIYEKILIKLKYYDFFTSSIKNIELVLDKARRALQLSVFQNGMIPPIGDSPCYRSGVESILGLESFSENGFSVYKTEDLYFSFICGSSTEIHKQMDDTSFYCQYKGRDIFIDSGSYSYDREDKNRVLVASSNGHSGIFPRAFDLKLRNEVKMNYPNYLAKTEKVFQNSNGVYMEGSYVFNEKVRPVNRKIFITASNEVVITDEFDDEFDSFIQRFILAPGLSSHSEGGNIRIIGEGLSVSMYFFGERNDIRIVDSKASYEFGSLLDCYCIENNVKTSDKLSTVVISLDGVSSVRDLSDLAKDLAYNGVNIPAILDESSV